MMPEKNGASESAPEEALADNASDDSFESEQEVPAGNSGVEGNEAQATAEEASAQQVEPATVDDGADDIANVTASAPAEEVTPASAKGEDDEVMQLRRQLAEAESQASEHWDRLLRLQAEMENQRKRAQNDVNKARKFALEGIVGDLLPVKDSLELGLSASAAEDADPKALVEGVQLTLKQLSQAFEKHNIVEIDPIDEKFDPEFHQAMSMQEVEGKTSNTVTAVMQKGYTLNDRLVRPALVMVAR